MPPEKIDTEGAIEDMRLANSYLDDWIAKKNSGNHLLGLAAKYIESARRKDPNAKLVGEEKGEPFIFSQDDLSGTALFYESQLHSREQASPKELEKARAILEKAIAYVPSSIQYRSHLADLYLNLHDKDHALVIARQAIEVSPKNLDARKLLDRIDAAPRTRAPTYFKRNPGGLVGIGIVSVILGVICLFFEAFRGLSLFLLIGGGVCWLYGSIKERDKMYLQAVAEQKRKNKG